jgi:phosphoribosylanthranilate isomerase
MSKIKICGLKSAADINFANIAKPDYIGFIFAEVKRKIDFNAALKFRYLLNNEIKSVGVFVNDKIENIVNLHKNKTINLV